MQQPPPAQVLLAQQGPFAVPHWTQVPVLAEHASGLRQGAWVVPPQQGSFSRPHSHVPFDLQTPPTPELMSAQVAPVATQRPPEVTFGSLEQQAPVAEHLFPAQQGLPVTPQASQVGLTSFV